MPLFRTTVALAENPLLHAIGVAVHPIFVVIATLLATIYGAVPSFGVAIILLTLVVMAALLPLSVRSIRSMAAMQHLQPEITGLRRKFTGPDNREQLNWELLRLCTEHGVYPAAGCLPMFLQVPFMIVLYDVIKGLTNTVTTTIRGHLVNVAQPRYLPTSSRMYHDLVMSHGVMNWLGINLALKPFSTHAQWFGVFPYLALVLIAVLIQYLQMAQMRKRSASSSANQHTQLVQRLMPLLFGYIGLLVPASVTVYMIASTAIRMVTQRVLARVGATQPPTIGQGRD